MRLQLAETNMIKVCIGYPVLDLSRFLCDLKVRSDNDLIRLMTLSVNL